MYPFGIVNTFIRPILQDQLALISSRLVTANGAGGGDAKDGKDAKEDGGGSGKQEEDVSGQDSSTNKDSKQPETTELPPPFGFDPTIRSAGHSCC